MRAALRLPLFACAIAALLFGVLAGLARLGVGVPTAMAMQAGQHGALMICGLFGTLISLERAVAMARPWPYLAPLGAALGTLLLLAGAPLWGQALYALAALVLSAASLVLWRQQAVLHLATLALAALAWLAGTLVWSVTHDIAAAVPCWQAFLVLTIAGERLELSRFLPTPARARYGFGVIVVALLVAVMLPATLGTPVFALALMALVLWLLRYDIVRHSLRQSGLPRYIAVCLASGYVWLLLSAVLMLLDWPGTRDAALHSMLLGFVFSMVFGHAPIVLPAVARIKLPYHAALYWPLLCLQLSLALRVGAGLADQFVWRQQAAVGNALALLWFALTVITLIVRARPRRGEGMKPQ